MKNRLRETYFVAACQRGPSIQQEFCYEDMIQLDSDIQGGTIVLEPVRIKRTIVSLNSKCICQGRAQSEPDRLGQPVLQNLATARLLLGVHR